MSTPLLRTRQARAAVVLVALWGGCVALWAAISYPAPAVAAIEARWAYKRVELLRTSHDESTSHRELRRKIFGDKSDAQIVRPERFDIATAVPVDQTAPEFAAETARTSKVVALDSEYAAMLTLEKWHIFVVTIVLALGVWLTPLAVGTLARAALSWVRRGAGA